MCPLITCKFCGEKGHMMDWCYHNTNARFGTKRDDKPHLYAPRPETVVREWGQEASYVDDRIAEMPAAE